MFRLIRRIFYWLFWVVLQVFLFNKLVIFGGNIVHVYLYAILVKQTYNPIYNLFRGMIIGFSIDIFNNTYGMHAAGCTCMVFILNFIIGSSFENKSSLLPLTISNLGFKQLVIICLGAITLYECCICFIDSWSATITQSLLKKISISTLFTSVGLIFIYLINKFFAQKNYDKYKKV